MLELASLVEPESLYVSDAVALSWSENDEDVLNVLSAEASFSC
jgi:hypothetical protein